ncbi:hypothetical protein HKD37_06G016609 [Glycine soja]
MASNSQQFSARNDAIVIRGVHEVATNSSSSAETKKLEGKLDALVNLVTQLAMNQKSALVARLCGLCFSADHHTDLFPSPEAYAANIYNRPPQPQQQNQPQQNNYDLSSNRASIQSLTNQMGQLATQLNQQQAQNYDRLPSQSVKNPKNCQEPQPATSSSSANELAQLHPTPEKDDDKNLKSKLPNNFYADESSTGNSNLQKHHILLPFPPRAISNKKNGRSREGDLGNI